MVTVKIWVFTHDEDPNTGTTSYEDRVGGTVRRGQGWKQKTNQEALRSSWQEKAEAQTGMAGRKISGKRPLHGIFGATLI